MQTKTWKLAALAATLLTGTLAAQDSAPPPPPIREPLPPKISDTAEQIAPEVRIRRQQDRTVEEYLSNGRVYMVRIRPTSGPAYYLVDTTGDGVMNLRHERFEPVKPVYWKLFEW
ncbi:MAG: DUF2782 domain-containing protein [Wenzhouxiangellaceae bacterium]|nr:DUF2782 domain-containing protein [Wenzhouxiangellaceae bacterium]